MTFQPANDMPSYATWTQAQLVVACTNYHMQLLKLRTENEQLRLALKESKK